MQSTLAAAVRILERDFSNFCAERLQPLGLSGGLLYFVLYLGHHPGCTPGALSAGIHADSGHVARSLAKLEHLSYIRREPNPHDKRAFELYLTPEGENAYHTLQNLFSEWDAYVLAPLSEEDRHTLLTLLHTVISTHAPNLRCSGQSN